MNGFAASWKQDCTGKKLHRTQAVHDGLISSQTAMKMIDAADRQLNEPAESSD
jgi:hypothetical protein